MWNEANYGTSGIDLDPAIRREGAEAGLER